MKPLAIAVAILLLPFAAHAGTTGSLTGTVIGVTGAPIANAKVVVTSGADVATTTTDSRGHFAIVSLSPGIYDVIVGRDGFLPTRIGATVLADTSLHLALSLTPAPTIIARVRHYDVGTLVKQHTVSDVYVFGTPASLVAPPIESDLWMLLMTPGITFGPGMPVAH